MVANNQSIEGTNPDRSLTFRLRNCFHQRRHKFGQKTCHRYGLNWRIMEFGQTAR